MAEPARAVTGGRAVEMLQIVNLALSGTAIFFLLRLEHRLATLEAQVKMLLKKAGLG